MCLYILIKRPNVREFIVIIRIVIPYYGNADCIIRCEQLFLFILELRTTVQSYTQSLKEICSYQDD